MATRIPAQPERLLSIGRARCRGVLCCGVRRRAILRAPDKVGRDGVPPVSQSNCCAERCTVDILKHGSAEVRIVQARNATHSSLQDREAHTVMTLASDSSPLRSSIASFRTRDKTFDGEHECGSQDVAAQLPPRMLGMPRSAGLVK
jgi:hypothetical protein